MSTMMEGFIDLHQHVLWGLDDGPRTPDEMHNLLRADAKDGIRMIAATSHALPGIRPFDLDLYDARLREAQAYCDVNQLPIRLICGAEIRYTSSAVSMLLDKRIPTLGDSEYVLVEFWHSVDRKTFAQAIDSLFRNGFIPVVAHVERYALFYTEMNFVLSLKSDYEVYYQVNCDFLLQHLNFFMRLRRQQMLKLGIFDLVSTDAHNTITRPPRMNEVYKLFHSKENAQEYLPLFIVRETGERVTD